MVSDKNILVISHNSFSKVANNGKTLESLFKAFDKINIAQLFFSENESPDFDFCYNYFKVSDSDVLKGIFKRKGGVKRRLIEDSNSNTEITVSDKGIVRKLFNVAKLYADNLYVVRDLLWLSNSWKSPGLFSWIEDFNPDVIFYVGGNSGFSHSIARFISKKYNLPLAVYFTDDYLIHPKNRNILDRIQRNRMRKFYDLTVSQASLCFAIGEIMSKEYTDYFKKKFHPVMNSIDYSKYVEYHKNDGPVVFSYFGGLHLERWKMLLRIGESAPNSVIKVYSVQKPSPEILKQFDKANISFMGGVKGKDLENAILESDVLLHVESDDTYYRFLTKLSVSTKIPEYLMSGRPILGFGPDDVASMKILSSNGIGIVLSSTLTQDELKKKLEEISANYDFRKQIGLKGHEYAVAKFDNKVISTEFKNKLTSLTR